MESKKSSMQYAIVKFPKEDDARGIIPMKWINVDEGWCYYPDVKTNEMLVYHIKNSTKPTEEWSKHEMIVLKSYETYSDARLKLREAEVTSNLESEEEIARQDGTKIRKKRVNTRLQYPGEETSESEQEHPKMMKYSKLHNLPPYPKFEAKQTYCADKLEQTLNEVIFEESPIHYNKEAKKSAFDDQPISFLTPQNKKITVFDESPVNALTKSTAVQSVSVAPKENSVKVGKLMRGILQLQTSMADLARRQIEMDRKIDSVLATIGNQEKENYEDDTDTALLSLLPLQSMADFETLENKLKEVPSLKNKFIKLFMSVGGSDVKTLTFNIIRRALTDELAQKFSFTGKKGYKDEKKMAFASTQLLFIILIAVRKMFKDTFCEATAKKHLTMWLNQAKTRLTRREERRKSGDREADIEATLTTHEGD